MKAKNGWAKLTGTEKQKIDRAIRRGWHPGKPLCLFLGCRKKRKELTCEAE